VAHLKSEVNAGSSFARALATAPREFDEIYRAVVAAGEQSGALGAVLERLADDLEQQQALRAKVLGAMLYPAIVSLVAVIIVTVLVTWVVPQIANVFTSSKRALPFLTVAMLGLSGFVRQWGWAVLRCWPPAARHSAWPAERGLSRIAPTPRCCACRCWAAWRAATTRPASAARWPCWPEPGAHPQGPAGGGRDTGQPGHAPRRAGRPGAGARRRAAGQRAGRQEALSRACWPCSPGWVNRPASCRACWTAPQPSSPAEVQRRAMGAATILEPLLIVGMGLVVVVIMLAVLLPIIQLNTWVK
jgi:general secretion pathway protein F